MLDLTGVTDGTVAASLRPWINVLAGMASRLWMGVAILAGLTAPAANAQLQTPFATGVTAPAGGLVLSGTAVNPRTGNPYRHLWSIGNQLPQAPLFRPDDTNEPDRGVDTGSRARDH